MNMENKFTQFFQEDNNLSVVSFGDNVTFKISRLLGIANKVLLEKSLDLINEYLKNYGLGSLQPMHKNQTNWNIYGMDAEILEPNTKAWKKGKIRMRVVLEFCPEESEEEQPETISNRSPLDDIRQTIN